MINQIIQTKLKSNKKRKYQLQLALSIIITIILLLFLFIKSWKEYQNEKISKRLLNNYQLTTLYSDTLQDNLLEQNSNKSLTTPFVIRYAKN